MRWWVWFKFSTGPLDMIEFELAGAIHSGFIGDSRRAHHRALQALSHERINVNTRAGDHTRAGDNTGGEPRAAPACLRRARATPFPAPCDRRRGRHRGGRRLHRRGCLLQRLHSRCALRWVSRRSPRRWGSRLRRVPSRWSAADVPDADGSDRPATVRAPWRTRRTRRPGAGAPATVDIRARPPLMQVKSRRVCGSEHTLPRVSGKNLHTRRVLNRSIYGDPTLRGSARLTNFVEEMTTHG